MDITVNGTRHPVDADPDEAVVGVLRDRLGLTGTKLVCGAGVCGACTVQVDGTPMVSCLLPCGTLGDREVTTVEGLSGTHPVQRALALHDGLQCGYCTPGFAVEGAAFVDKWRAAHGDVNSATAAPDRAEIADALAGHLCRCGAYEGIYAAFAAACAGRHDTDDGTLPPRVEAMEKVTGRARYTTDVRLDGQLEGVLIRSTSAHAVVRTVTAPAGATLIDLLPADRTVRYVGQLIAAVADTTLAAARGTAAQVLIEYDERPALIDFAAARVADSTPIYESKGARRDAPVSAEGPSFPVKWKGNIRGPLSMSWRSGTAVRRIDAAAEKADPGLVSGTYTTAVQVHTPLEPHCCVAHWDPDGDLHLYVSTQGVGVVAEYAAKTWKLPEHKVHVHAEHVGGGFGAKTGVTKEVDAAVELARATGKPVRVVLDRSAELTAGGNRAGTESQVRLLAGADGELSAMAIDIHAEGGVSVASAVAALARFMYGNAPRRLRDYDVLTNLPPATPFRGPGGPPLLWALEGSVDELAHRRGEDPIALRRRWDGNPKRAALYDWASALPVWSERPPSGSQTGRFRRGVGVAAANWFYFLDPGSEVALTVEGGTVVARCSVQDMGTGIRSVISGILTAELGLPRDRVRVEVGRSDAVHGPLSGGSRTTPSVAPAAHDAAVRLRTALKIETGSVADALDGADGVSVTGRRSRDKRGYVTPMAMDNLAVGRGFSGAVHVTEVEVDTRLGKVRATRVWGGLAVGHIYAERLARSQCEGSIIQGVGFALYEQRHVDPHTGVVLTDNLEDYRIPGIGDTPQIEIHFHQQGWEHVTGGGVGLGEIATIGVAASIGNAVHAATGWRPRDLPIRPDRVLEGIAR